MNRLIKVMMQQRKKDGTGALKFTDGSKMTRLHETEVSREIRILAEVEKIWIIFDCDQSGALDSEELKGYLQFIFVNFSEEQLNEIFSLIDDDMNGTIDKNEMFMFLKVLMIIQEDVTFKDSSALLEHYEKMKQKKR